jgi:hypothetical protein
MAVPVGAFHDGKDQANFGLAGTSASRVDGLGILTMGFVMSYTDWQNCFDAVTTNWAACGATITTSWTQCAAPVSTTWTPFGEYY